MGKRAVHTRNLSAGTTGGGVVRIVASVFTFILALLFLFPFYWMLIGAFKTRMDLMAFVPQWFPLHPTPENFRNAFSQTGLRWLFNSVLTSVLYTLCTIAICTMAGYSLAKKRYPGRQLIFWFFILVMAVPKNSMLVPLFLLVKDLKIVDRYAGLILPFIAWPFGIFLMRQFIQTLPDELFEAAKIDGANEVYLFTRIVTPLVVPGIISLSVFGFRDSWNDYFWQLIVLSSTAMKTLPLGLAGMMDDTNVEYSIIMAGSVIASLPIIVLFLAFQKSFTAGIAMSAIKG
jgi:multiple sugar transport system permease protein